MHPPRIDRCTAAQKAPCRSCVAPNILSSSTQSLPRSRSADSSPALPNLSDCRERMLEFLELLCVPHGSIDVLQPKRSPLSLLCRSQYLEFIDLVFFTGIEPASEPRPNPSDQGFSENLHHPTYASFRYTNIRKHCFCPPESRIGQQVRMPRERPPSAAGEGWHATCASHVA